MTKLSVYRHFILGLALFTSLLFGCTAKTHEILSTSDCTKTVAQGNKTYAVFDTSLCNHGMLHDKTVMTFYVKDNLNDELKSLLVNDFDRITALKISSEVVFVNIIVLESESTFSYNNVAELIEEAFVKSNATTRFRGYQATFYFLDEKKIFPEMSAKDSENLFSNLQGIAPNHCKLINEAVDYVLSNTFSHDSGCEPDSTLIMSSYIKPNAIFSEMIGYASTNKFVQSSCRMDTSALKNRNYRLVDIHSPDYSAKDYTMFLGLTQPYVRDNHVVIGRTIMGAKGSWADVVYFELSHRDKA